jgi:hypothetical protein
MPRIPKISPKVETMLDQKRNCQRQANDAEHEGDAAHRSLNPHYFTVNFDGVGRGWIEFVIVIVEPKKNPIWIRPRAWKFLVMNECLSRKSAHAPEEIQRSQEKWNTQHKENSSDHRS